MLQRLPVVLQDRYITRAFPRPTAIGNRELSASGVIVEIKLIAAFPD